VYYLIMLSFTWQYLGSVGQALLDEREKGDFCVVVLLFGAKC
jgi:hypothetical protein